MKPINSLLGDRKAATAIEYSLVAVLIAVAAITGFRALGGNLDTTYTSVSDTMGEQP